MQGASFYWIKRFNNEISFSNTQKSNLFPGEALGILSHQQVVAALMKKAESDFTLAAKKLIIAELWE